MKTLRFPLIKITLCFAFGILFSQIVRPDRNVLIGLTIFSLFLLLYFFKSTKKKPEHNLFFGLTTLTVSFLIGCLTLILNIQTLRSNHYIFSVLDSEKDKIFELCIDEKLKSTLSNNRYIAKVVAINDKITRGKIILNIKKTTTPFVLESGYNLKVKGAFYKNRKPYNPNQFDYGKYLENQQVYGQIYCESNTILRGSITNKGLNYFTSKVRNTIVDNLKKNNFGTVELNVLIALILGQQQDISKEVIRDYQYAGAIHILSVSGLHVGFILFFVTLLLKPLPNSKLGVTLKLIIVISTLWLFGILAGLVPSVVRSVTMFSFVAIGMYLRRSVNIYNTLFVSALIILLIKPSFLFDVGFQLSYVCLFFIVWLQPLLASIFTPKNKIISYFWELLTVSFAAQVGALPLSVYYFHQFPGLFFITNLIILPFLSILLAMGVIVVVFAAIDIVWIPLIKLLQYSIWFMNKIIAHIASFEEFIFKDIPLNFYIMLSWYLVIFSCILWLKKPSFQKLVIGLTAIIVLQLTSLYMKYSNENCNEFIVFSSKNSTLITQRLGKDVTVFANDSLVNTIEDNINLKSYLVANYSKIKQKSELQNCYYFKKNKILLIDHSATYLKEFNPDVLIITQSPKLNLERLFKYWKPRQVVVDASNFKTYVKIWGNVCKKEKIPFHDTSEKGFYKL